MRIEVSLFDHDGNARPWEAIANDLMEKVMVAGIALYGNKSAACSAFKIGRSTMYRRAKPKPRPKPVPAKPVAIVSELGFLDARARFDPAWPADLDKRLRELHAVNASVGVIAAEIRRPYQAVERRLAKLGLRPSAYKHERENAL
jgi:hypothetical protein